jgi:hypothetical protein
MRIGKISPAQKNIIIAGAVALAAFLLFMFLVFLPNRKSVMALRLELISTERQIHEIQAMPGEVKNMEKGMQLLQERFRQLEGKCSLGEEDSVQMLSDTARKMNIELVSIKPQAKAPFLDENNQEVTLEGAVCRKVSILMELKCSYKDLVRYVTFLRESYPGLVSIEKIRINKNASGPSRLNVELVITLYLLR